MTDLETLEITAGWRWWRHIRNFVRRAQFDGHDVRLHEEKAGWLVREFVIKGPPRLLHELEDAIKKRRRDE